MKRKDTISRVDRAVLPDVKIRTVYGTVVPEVVRCKTCGEVRNKNDFYLDLRYDEIRNQCIPCWDLHKGRTKPKYVPTNTLYNGESE
jgi:hypothetical protein